MDDEYLQLVRNLDNKDTLPLPLRYAQFLITRALDFTSTAYYYTKDPRYKNRIYLSLKTKINGTVFSGKTFPTTLGNTNCMLVLWSYLKK